MTNFILGRCRRSEGHCDCLSCSVERQEEAQALFSTCASQRGCEFLNCVCCPSHVEEGADKEEEEEEA